jgi:hypothetical protein
VRVKLIAQAATFGVDTPAKHGSFVKIVRKVDNRPFGWSCREGGGNLKAA